MLWAAQGAKIRGEFYIVIEYVVSSQVSPLSLYIGGDFGGGESEAWQALASLGCPGLVVNMDVQGEN